MKQKNLPAVFSNVRDFKKLKEPKEKKRVNKTENQKQKQEKRKKTPYRLPFLTSGTSRN